MARRLGRTLPGILTQDQIHLTNIMKLVIRCPLSLHNGAPTKPAPPIPFGSKFTNRGGQALNRFRLLQFCFTHRSGWLCGTVGLALGVSLIELSRRGMEAALWAVIIHVSLEGEIHEDLNYHTANPLSPWAAVLLLYKKFLGKVSTGNKKAIRNLHKDRTPWWLCVVLFLVTSTMAACLVFILGRIVDIYTIQQTQTTQYYETTVVGDLTLAEIARASSQVEDTFSQVKYTWTITPLSSTARIPTDRYFEFCRTTNINGRSVTINDTVHFAETFPAQLAPADQQPAGFGTFLNQSDVGGMLDLGRYLTPHSTGKNMTYLVFPPVNFTAFMELGDKPNITVTEKEIAITSKWWDNGVSHSFDYQPVSRGDDGNGWLTVEIVMNLGRQRIEPRLGLMRLFSAGSPISLNLRYAGTRLHNSTVMLSRLKPDDQPKSIGQLISENVQHGITSAGKWAVYNASHYNARNIMLKDNGRDWWFVPNPTVVAFGGGMAPTEYTRLSPANIARILSDSDSQHLTQLPYLVGTQPIVAYVFPDKTVAYTHVYTTWLVVTLGSVLFAGIAVSLFVPRLPLGVSRKDIGVSSWLVAIEGQSFNGLRLPQV
ncbi:transmembrane protein [Ceratobasidium sp. AG-Ba]|nr:transmembrane protein [Ceratobasidium sp. AG-Ba]